MIGSSSDLLVDVAKAADPQRAAAARRRLDSLAASGSPQFDNLIAAPVSGPPRVSSAPGGLSGLSNGNLTMKASRKQNREGDTYRSLGALLLQKAFEAIIPASNSTGASKSASSVWKSMLAQQLADTASAAVFPSRPSVRETAAERVSS